MSIYTLILALFSGKLNTSSFFKSVYRGANSFFQPTSVNKLEMAPLPADFRNRRRDMDVNPQTVTAEELATFVATDT